MNELKAILSALNLPLSPCAAGLRKSLGGEVCALATVVQVQGSAYRRPGARMLILPDGERIGCVSGGCLEADICARAQTVIATGKSCLTTYDSRNNFDLTLELGCGGSVAIWIERVAPADPPAYLQWIAECLQNRQAGVLATVFRAEGAGNILPGQRVGFAACGNVVFNSEAAWVSRMPAEIADVLRTGRPVVQTVMLPTTTLEVLLEPLVPPISLVLCGAGQDAPPLAQMATLLGWEITVADHRADYLTAHRFPGATLTVAGPERLRERVNPDARTVAVVMTHSYTRDLELLRVLLPQPFAYVGLLGPKHRRERLVCDLQAEMPLTETMLARLHAPVGLDLGAETPAEVACSIVAEIQAVLARRKGGSLRERKGSVHGN